MSNRRGLLINEASGKNFQLASDIVNIGGVNISPAGEITGFSSGKYLQSRSRSYTTINNIDIHFKTGAEISSSQCIMQRILYYNQQGFTNPQTIIISTGKLKIGATEVCDVHIDTDYRIQGSISNNVFTATIKANEIIVANGSYSFAINPATYQTTYVNFGIYVYYGNASAFLGTLYGDTNFLGLIGE